MNEEFLDNIFESLISSRFIARYRKREGKKLKWKNECGYKCILHMYDKFFVDYKWKEQKLTKWWMITSTSIKQS